jgi:RNA polymerase sigma-70 factor (ECF subfamily)
MVFQNLHLISLCAKGDARAQKQLYDELNGYIMFIIKRYSSDECEDIFQETFIKIFNNIDQVKEPFYFIKWAKQIAINTSINYLKKKPKFDEFNQEVNRSIEIDEVINKLEIEDIIAIINQLDKPYNIVLNMYLIDDLSHEDISTTLCITQSHSRVILTRAKQMLNKKLIAIYSNKNIAI